MSDAAGSPKQAKDSNSSFRISRGGGLGTDSADPTIGAPAEPVGGGRTSGVSTSAGSRRRGRSDGRAPVRHEFLHALGFHHAHQSMRGPCENEFRWDDDPRYQPTRDPRGVFIPDASGRRPGIYTFLAGPPNNWPRGKVDHNLRTDDDPELVAGPFDRASVMLYVFADFFYKTVPSSCGPTGSGIDLSTGDKRGLRLLYTETAEQLAERAAGGSRGLWSLRRFSHRFSGGAASKITESDI